MCVSYMAMHIAAYRLSAADNANPGEARGPNQLRVQGICMYTPNIACQPLNK